MFFFTKLNVNNLKELTNVTELKPVRINAELVTVGMAMRSLTVVRNNVNVNRGATALFRHKVNQLQSQ